MTIAETCSAFAVSQSTGSAKANAMSKALKIQVFDPAWMLASLADHNPLTWIFELSGLVVDLREMLREVQVIAYEAGMIPYVPADEIGR